MHTRRRSNSQEAEDRLRSLQEEINSLRTTQSARATIASKRHTALRGTPLTGIDGGGSPLTLVGAAGEDVHVLDEQLTDYGLLLQVLFVCVYQ
jgi:hypothetical protein